MAAGNCNQADAGQLRNFLGKARVDQILESGQGHCFGSGSKGYNWRIRGIYLVVNGRIGQILRQKVAGRIDCGLNFLFCHIQLKGKIKLQGNGGSAGAGKRSHLRKAGHDAKLSFERRGYNG